MKKLLKGFTLVEIMLAAAILVAVMAAFLSSFTSTFRSTNYSQGISLAGRAAENKVEEMVNFTFDSLMAQYGANGTGRNFTFNASGLTGAGIVNVTDRRDLYGGGGALVNASAPWGHINSGRGQMGLHLFDNRIWIMGGLTTGAQYDDVWYSVNGIGWTCATSRAAPLYMSAGGRRGHCSLVYDNKLWIMCGDRSAGGSVYYRDVWYSNNGAVWMCATQTAAWLGRSGAGALVYDNRMWIMGGGNGTRLNDVWYSYDGVAWNQSTANANWSDRNAFAALVYGGKMWVMGGTINGGYANDVWYSTDGANWTQATANAGWSGRESPTALVYDNKMWVMNGYNGFGGLYYNDVWYSTDGANWTRAAVNATWPPRAASPGIVYDNKMWVMGGRTVGNGYIRDVWSSTGYNRILEADIAVSWKHPDGRQFGEDTNLDGVWNNTTEDANNNTIYDSPARLRQLLVEDSTTGKLRRIYMGR